MRVFLLIGFATLVTMANAQTAKITRVELAGEKVIVHYDLEDGNPNNEYKLDLYSSKDNFTTPLTKVKGDIGAEVKPGLDRKVEWSIVEEFGGYTGKIALEIRGKVYIPFVKLQNFTAKKSYKRGSSHNVAWKPGNANPINIEIFKGGQRIHGDMNLPNNGSHTVYFPSNSKPGKDYRLKISDSKNSEEVLYTAYFHVKPKLPLLLKILPFAAIGGVAATLGGGDKDSKSADLPTPPGTPTN